MTVEEWAGIKYFKPKEFDSPDVPGSGALGMQLPFVQRLDALRTVWGKPLFLNSGFRTQDHNQFVGGVPESSHTKGLAADIRTANLQEAMKLALYAAFAGFLRVGIDLKGRYIHVDTDETLPRPAVWFYGARR